MEAKYNFETKYRKQVLQCSRCGFCQAVCPVFGLTLRPSLNARGKMLLLKEIMDGEIDLDSEELVETLYQCTTCASCEENCPSGVNVPDIIKEARKDMVHIGSCHPAFKGMNEVLQESGNIYAEDEPEDFERKRNQKAEHVYFIGCVGSYREDEATMSVLALLDRLKVDYTLIDEVCCTGVLEDLGYPMIDKHVRTNIDLILATGAKTVITGCPYCSRTFNNKPQYAELKEKGIRVVHIIQFLKDFDFGVQTEKRVTYHDPCDLGRHCGIYDEPREIIRKIAPNFVEMPHTRENALCCGAGGGVRGAYPKNSIGMARRRLKEVEEVDADILLTECNSCLHNFSNAKLRKQKFKIYNITQFISKLMEEGSEKDKA
ncbi:MAG: (Fe-S)-binding protein [Deltaproteobacteria bacterium]|nr:(Fe-S)-binding protein [Deltaproteobacteria bacterium]